MKVKIKKLFLCLIFLLILFSFIVILTSKTTKEQSVDLTSISSGDSQTVAILDTGINNKLLEENKNNIVKVINVIDGSEKITDELGHGTALTSLLLGSEQMNLKGLLPDVNVILIKIADENGKSTFENLLKGLDMAEKNNATIINISLGADISNIEVTKKINDLYKKNITVIAASGDYGDKDILYPANLPTVISVASTDSQYNLSKFSNFNENNICAFPGENLNMLSINNDVLEKTNELTGTSYAAIYASGYVAAIRDYAVKHNITISNKRLFSILKKNDPLKNKKIITQINNIFKED